MDEKIVSQAAMAAKALKACSDDPDDVLFLSLSQDKVLVTISSLQVVHFLLEPGSNNDDIKLFIDKISEVLEQIGESIEVQKEAV